MQKGKHFEALFCPWPIDILLISLWLMLLVFSLSWELPY